jgi:hypothetical protein
MRLPQLGQDGVFPPTPVLIRVAAVGVGTGLATGETVCRRGGDDGLVGATGLGDAPLSSLALVAVQAAECQGRRSQPLLVTSCFKS